jgi:hypothetical protein
MKEDDIIGILDTDDVKDLKPLGDRILIKVCSETYYFDTFTEWSLYSYYEQNVYSISVLFSIATACSICIGHVIAKQYSWLCINFRIMTLWCSIYFSRKKHIR